MNTIIKKVVVACSIAIGVGVSALAETFPGLWQYYWVAPQNNKLNETRYNYEYFSDVNSKGYKAAEAGTGPVRVLGVIAGDSNGSTFQNSLTSETYTWDDWGCYIYEGEIYLEQGKTYTFCAAFDDGAAVLINGNVIAETPTETTGWNQPGWTGTFTPPATGWYPILGYIWDWSGGKTKGNLLSGIQWTDSDNQADINNTGKRSDASLWNRLMDDGSGTFLRCSDEADSSTATLTVAVENDVVASYITPEVGTYTLSAGRPPQSTNCAAEVTFTIEGVKYTCLGYAIQTTTDNVTWTDPATNLNKFTYTYTANGNFNEKLTWIYNVVQIANKHIKAGEDVQLEPGGSGTVLVEAGGSVDIANIGYASDYSFIIAGDGVNGKGAIYDSSNDETVTNTIAGLTLNGDATVVANHPWGVMPSDPTIAEQVPFSSNSTVLPYDDFASLYLEGATLTKKGTSDFSLSYVIQKSNGGTIDCKEGNVTLLACLSYDGSANHSSALIIRNGASVAEIIPNNNCRNTEMTLTLEENTTFYSKQGHGLTSQTACNMILKYATLEPITFSGEWKCYRDTLARLDLSLIKQDTLTMGSSFMLVTNTTSSSIMPNQFEKRYLGTRYVVDVESKMLTVTVQKQTIDKNHIHYDFEGGVENTKGSALANDSAYATGISASEVAPARGGQAGLLNGNQVTWYFPGTPGNRPFVAGNLSVAMVIRPVESNGYMRAIMAFGQSDARPLIVIAVENENTISIGALEKDETRRRIATVTNIPNLTTKEHFVVAKFTPYGTTLIVDDLKHESTEVVPMDVNACSSIGGYWNGKKCIFPDNDTQINDMPSSGGLWLNDLKVFLADLTPEEIAKFRNEFWKTGFMVIVK